MMNDIVYFVREGEENDELRVSLRTVEANLPHRYIWIIGYKPTWVSDDVKHIAVAQDQRTKYLNVLKNWGVLIDSKEISDEFTLFNDDFYCLRPVKAPLLFINSKGTLRSNSLRNSWEPWKNKKYATYLALKKWDYPYYDYALHVPMTMTKKQAKLGIDFIKVNNLENKASIRSIIGNVNYMHKDATRIEDVKISSSSDQVGDISMFLSSNDRSINIPRVKKRLKKYLN